MRTKGTILKAKILIPIILCGVMIFWNFAVHADEWTEAEKEVWKVIETRWEHIRQGDYKAFEASMHDDAIVWWGRNALPLQKDLIMGSYQGWMSSPAIRPETYQLEPFAIQIIGDIANVFFSYSWKAKNGSSDRARALVSLKKQNGKWLTISSTSSSCNKLPACIE
jgi:ketosteroid isomerase-like protein